MQVDPSQALPYAGQLLGDLALNRLEDARAIYQAAKAHHLDAGEITRLRYLLAFLEGDNTTMTQTAELLEHERGFEDLGIEEQARNKIYFGQVRAAREMSQVIADTAKREKDNQALRDFEEDTALEDALLGRSTDARQHANASLRIGGEPAMAFALIGDIGQANKMAEKWASRAAERGFANGIWIPELQAAIELKRGNALSAVELLGPVKRYEAGWTDKYMAAYLRGQAYLAARRGPEAALEFQKVLDHRGVVLSSLIGALAHVGLARALALQGDIPRARASYENFFDLWRDADQNVPILITAKSEYAKLR
jgi:hypothetical protein